MSRVWSAWVLSETTGRIRIPIQAFFGGHDMHAVIKRASVSGLISLVATATLSAGGADRRLADAVERRDHSMVRGLLKARADVNGGQPDGATALQLAADWDDLETADLLLRPGADA